VIPSAGTAIPAAEAVATGFRYPGPGSADLLVAAVDRVPPGPVRRCLQEFVDAVTALELGRWEELHTATLDLGPRFAPYVGHAIWADNYQRGAFMAELASAQQAAGLDLGGELPDHIEPVLRYLAVAEQPLPELIEILPRALRQMEQSLARSEPDSPYRSLLEASVALVADLRPRRSTGRARDRASPGGETSPAETSVWLRRSKP
jgi:nitrate reductase delta subunit